MAYAGNYGGQKRIYIDGGIFMSNPTLGAITEISRYHADPFYNLPDLNFDDICVLSLGTGHYTSDAARKNVESWGLLDWARPITDIMMQGNNQATAYEANELIANGQYLRLSINIPDKRFSKMDDSSAATRNYLTEQTYRQVFYNTVLMGMLDEFLKG